MGVEAVDGPGLKMWQVLAASLFTNCTLSGNSNFQKNVIFGDSHFMYQKVYITVYTHVLMYMLISFWLCNAESGVTKNAFENSATKIPTSQNAITRFIPLTSFNTHWKQQKTSGLLFSGNIEKVQWHELG